ncbi:MAG: ATP-binding protein [Acidobacteriota bacterium]|nr:ATP-binding protein [Acidobacteriota bacterium]
MLSNVRHLSLLWKILLSTSIAITILLAFTGWYVQDQVLRAMSQSLQSEVRSSFRAYESLWQSRAEMLRSVSLVLSNMSDVRAAFGTGDQATIRDTAGEIWSKISQSNGVFLVTDPRGAVIASLGGETGGQLGREVPAVRDSARNFPSQTAGFALQNERLYQMVVTPVYVQTARGPGLLNVLVAGYLVDAGVANDLKSRTGGSDFVFVGNGKPLASTMPLNTSVQLAKFNSGAAEPRHAAVDGREYAVIESPMRDLRGQPIGNLLIVRSFEGVRRTLATLETNLIVTWVAAILAGLGLSYLLARRLLEPVKLLDQAATRIARQDYETRVPEGGADELGRLARTFNTMCKSIQQARGDLIRHERISTIGRLSSSIVHDLRNPLAAIYGGAEMLIDGKLNDAQVQRLARNIYHSSRAMKDMLQDLADVSRGRIHAVETCYLHEVIEAAMEVHAAAAEDQGVQTRISVGRDLQLPLERARMERVFLNLISNALEAMPDGGTLDLAAERDAASILVRIEDSGPGIAPGILSRLFEPFVSSGKKNGLGLGLALSRQTVLDHGGELWAEKVGGKGAIFWVRLPA